MSGESRRFRNRGFELGFVHGTQGESGGGERFKILTGVMSDKAVGKGLGAALEKSALSTVYRTDDLSRDSPDSRFERIKFGFATTRQGFELSSRFVGTILSRRLIRIAIQPSLSSLGSQFRDSFETVGRSSRQRTFGQLLDRMAPAHSPFLSRREGTCSYVAGATTVAIFRCLWTSSRSAGPSSSPSTALSRASRHFAKFSPD